MANEVRLIDANALMDVIRQHEYSLATKQGSVDYGMFTLGIQQAIDEQPTVDAVPVVHGRWEKYQRYVICSNCDTGWPYYKNDTDRFRYCPNCGAKMDGDVNG